MIVKHRFSHRIIISLSAVITLSEDIKVNVVTENLSYTGACIQCNTVTRNLITPGGSLIRGGHSVELGFDFDVSWSDGGSRHFEALCQVAYSRRIAKERCQIGLEFKQIEAHSRDLLQEIIDSELQAGQPVSVHLPISHK